MSRRQALTGAHSFNMNMDLTALNATLVKLGAVAQEAARPAAQAAAQVYYDAVKDKVAGLGRVTGNLASSIYQKFSEEHSGPGVARYHVSWNHDKAPHGHLVEFGHIMRYQAGIGKDGKWFTFVRKTKRRKRKPSEGASQAAKDAYYVLRKGGPLQVPAQSFIRTVAVEKEAQAVSEALGTVLRRLDEAAK